VGNGMGNASHDIFWISVDPSLPVATWNRELGFYASAGWTMASADTEFRRLYESGEADYRLLVPNEKSSGALSPFQLTVTAPYQVEYNLELARLSVDPRLPSRLSSTFAFGTKQDAVKAARDARRPAHEVYAFKLERDELTRVHRANFDVVSLMRCATRIASLGAETLDAIGRHYWTGGAELTLDLPSESGFGRRERTTGVTWEYLIEGGLRVLERRH